VLDPAYKAYLPPVGGATIYLIGDSSKLNDPATEIAVRVHDGQTLSSAQPAAAAADDVSAARPRFHSFSFFFFRFWFPCPEQMTNERENEMKSMKKMVDHPKAARSVNRSRSLVGHLLHFFFFIFFFGPFFFFIFLPLPSLLIALPSMLSERSRSRFARYIATETAPARETIQSTNCARFIFFFSPLFFFLSFIPLPLSPLSPCTSSFHSDRA